MTGTRDRELPPELRERLRKARRLEWLTIAYLVSAVGLLALVLGSSQAMKTAWFEDLLSLPPRRALQLQGPDRTLPLRLPPHRLHRPPLRRPGTLRHGRLPLRRVRRQARDRRAPHHRRHHPLRPDLLARLADAAGPALERPAGRLSRAPKAVPGARPSQQSSLRRRPHEQGGLADRGGGDGGHRVGIGFGLWWADAVAAA